MRKTLYISTILLVLSCENNPTEIRYYPTDRDFSAETSQLILLDTTKLNFRQITNRVGTYDKDYGKLVVEFNDKKIKKRITPYIYDGGLIRSKNILRIKSDSILIDENYPISDLKQILKRHYLNKGKAPYYPDLPRNAIVEVTIDTNKTGKELKKVLTQLTRTFDEIKKETKDTIELRVFFDYLRQIPPPLPPPKMESKNE
ncbi:hypothetical protein DFQ11_101601 [Winogradskyella epiphytica]|uniref:Uncharacterized protein n=1 Tax=Winogradskyella epiphytica TaxID=262005 RepID=A0A2V4XIN1_9FLAO|nr:hypothetical protein [Winogradskyella epiphytica]PYE83170.1 hypothetical protein DFQ11_101601 [Winogradskyella epiphytica]GGW56336.1 hypothetical protein GCM10008085_04680 [Winogradskyella epiphytica]